MPNSWLHCFPARQQVTDKQLALAASAWEAYCSSNPTDIENVLQGDTSPLPFLSAALRAHLKRFPSTKNGLGRIENRALELIHAGTDEVLPNSFNASAMRNPSTVLVTRNSG